MRSRWMVVLFLGALGCHATGGSKDVVDVDQVVVDARRELLVALGDYVAPRAVDDPGPDIAKQVESRKRRLVDALVAKYHADLTSTDTSDEGTSRRLYAANKLFEDWNPLTYSKDDLIHVMGSPKISKENEVDHETLLTYEFRSRSSRTYYYTFKARAGAVVAMSILLASP